MAQSTETTPAVVVKKRPYWINVGLFLVIVVCLFLWFQRHMVPLLTVPLLAGGSVTLLALVLIVLGWIKWAMGEDLKKIPGWLFGLPHSYMLWALGAAAGLLILTSSVYVLLGDKTQGQSDYQVRVSRNATPYLDANVSSTQRMDGRPFLLRLMPATLTFEVQSPRRYQPLSQTRYPWSSLRVRVPDDFTPKVFHAVRILPGRRLFQFLPDAPGEAQPPFDLLITRGDDPPIKIEDLYRQSVYVGATDSELPWLFSQEDAGKRQAFYRRHLTEWQMPSEHHEKFTAIWDDQARAVFVSTPEFQDGDRLHIVLLRRGAGPPILDYDEQVGSETIKTVFLERPEP